MIAHIKLEQFKKVTCFETDLDDINILVGANNSGKSSVLQGIHFTIMAEVVRRHLGATTVSQDRLLYLPSQNFSVLRHGSPYTNYSGYTSTLSLTSESDTNNDASDSFQITLSKGRNYGNISIATSGNNKFRQQVTSYKELYSAYTPGLSGIPLSEKLVSPAVLRNAAANGDANLYLRNILYYIKEAGELAKLNQYIQSVFPGYIISVPHDPNTDIDISVNVTINGKSFPLELCGTGLLQVVQIMAYSVYFKPKLLLLDEPDEHLHPSNQILLCDTIKLLVQEMKLQVLLSTHSRHMISAFDGDARFIWMKNGEICRENPSSHFYNVLLDLGALDAYSLFIPKFHILPAPFPQALNTRKCRHYTQWQHSHFISCSNPQNNSLLKNSSIVIPSPSHSFLIVETVALLLRPLTILLTVDCVTPLMLLSLLTEISRSRHSCRIRSFTASPTFIEITSL